MGSAYVIKSLSITFGAAPPKSYTVEVSLDGRTWLVVGEEVQSFGSKDTWSFATTNSMEPDPIALYLRLVMTQPWVYASGFPIYSIAEIVVLGCAVAAPSAVLSESFQFRLDLTPVITSVSPNSGSTAGGTLIVIEGYVFCAAFICGA